MNYYFVILLGKNVDSADSNEHVIDHLLLAEI
jgi:hypothetical protein